MSGPTAIERRPFVGSAVDVSVVGVALDPSPVASASEDATTVAVLRHLRDTGVTMFDLARARVPARGIQLLSTAFSPRDPSLLILLDPPKDRGRSNDRSSAHRPSSGAGDPGEEDAPRFEQLVHAANRVGAAWIDWEPRGESEGQLLEHSRHLDRDLDEGSIAGWSLRVRSLDLPPPIAPRIRDRPVSVDFSLLDHRLLGALDGEFSGRRGRVVMRNVLADGRLDGTRIGRSLGARSPGARPPDLRTLHAEFDPVLALAPLTAHGRRTLAQAALQYALYWEWVAAAIVPLPSLERWPELRNAGERPALTGEELSRLGLIEGSRGATERRARPP